MSTFNVVVGVVVGIIAVIPLLFTKERYRKFVLVFAIILGLGAFFLSDKYLYPEYLGWRFERELKKQPLFASVAERHPKEFAAFIKQVKRALRDKLNSSQISIYSSQLLNEVFYQHLKYAPDDNILLYLKATIDLYQHVNGVDPYAVIKLETGNSAIPFDLNKLWEDKDFRVLLSHLLDTKRYIIEAGIKTSQTLPDNAMAESLLQALLSELAVKYGGDNVRKAFSPTDTSLPANVGAQIILQFYSSIVGTGKETASIIMRHIANLKTADKEENQVDLINKAGK